MLNGLKPLSRSLRWGMVGGGGTSQIGYSHRCAALRDNVYTLLAGALDVDAERGRAFGEQLGIAPERCYADYQTLFEQKTEQNRRRHLRLCRLSDDPAGAADDCRWTARRDPHR